MSKKDKENKKYIPDEEVKDIITSSDSNNFPQPEIKKVEPSNEVVDLETKAFQGVVNGMRK